MTARVEPFAGPTLSGCPGRLPEVSFQERWNPVSTWCLRPESLALPMKPGHAGTRTRACRRNGTTCLLAAPGTATGKVVGRTAGRHRPAEFLAFPGHVAGGIAPGTPVHVIPGNVASHKSAGARGWLKGRPDRTFHFTPTSAS